MGRLGLGFLFVYLFVVTSSWADLVGSKHDMSALGGEPCAYCHSVHHAVGGMGRPAYMGPLPDITEIYSSSTLDHTLDIAGVSSSDAPLCLTCHDGAFVKATGTPEGDDIFALIDGTPKDLTLDLRNDHPVGFVFDASLDDEIQAPTNPEVHVTFGPGKDEMWCSTCHDPHGGVAGTPLLTMDNDGSALCLECHLK